MTPNLGVDTSVDIVSDPLLTPHRAPRLSTGYSIIIPEIVLLPGQWPPLCGQSHTGCLCLSWETRVCIRHLNKDSSTSKHLCWCQFCLRCFLNRIPWLCILWAVWVHTLRQPRTWSRSRLWQPQGSRLLMVRNEVWYDETDDDLCRQILEWCHQVK